MAKPIGAHYQQETLATLKLDTCEVITLAEAVARAKAGTLDNVAVIMQNGKETLTTAPGYGLGDNLQNLNRF